MSSDVKRYEPGRVPEQRPGKAGGKRDLNRKLRTQALCEAALDLFLQRGVESVTVDEITRGAGVAKGSFYRYFEDKAQLVEALFEPLTLAMRDAMSRCADALAAAETPDALFAAYQQLATDIGATLLPNARLARLYLQECRGADEGARKPIRALSDEVMQGAFKVTDAARAHGLLRDDLPARITALAVVGAVEGLLFRMMEGVEIGEPAEVNRALISMVLDGVRKVEE